MALCPAPMRLVASGSARPSSHPSTKPWSKQTGRSAQTPGLGALSRVEPPHQRRLAQPPGGRPIWHLTHLLDDRTAL
jgi:hypothetical protein